MSFIHLHNHSEYSLLNGSIRVGAMVDQAKAFGQNAVGLTDYGNMFGAVDFYTAAKYKGIKPVLGCVAFQPSYDDHKSRTFRRGMDHLFQLVLFIQNKQGYLNLSKLITKSYLDGFYYKPRIDSNLLREHSEGILALSGGWDSALNHHLYEGQEERVIEWMELYASIFPGRFYVELQDNGIEAQKGMNEQLSALANRKGLPLVVTNNCHYLKQDEAEAFETLMCIQTGATLQGGQGNQKFSTDGYYFKSPEEMEIAFKDYPEALANTQVIADSCNFDFDLKTYYFPKFEPPQGLTLDDYLDKEARIGLDNRWPQIIHSRTLLYPDIPIDEKILKETYLARMELELKLIKQMGFSGYFLIVSDFISHAKNVGIPVGPGRGSAAGSLVAYCVRITDLDPLPYNLLFERFLNPERVSMPDVDIDFCMNGRSKVLEYVGKKYGNVSQIITFGKMKAKAVIRDVGRVMEMPYSDVDKIAKLIPNTLNITLADALNEEPRLQELADNDPQIERLIRIAKNLEGLNRHASTHAAGVVMSDQPLTTYLPLYKGSNGDVVTQFDMKYVEKIGLIKFDFLGLKTLTVISDALKIIKRTQNVEMEILDISLADKAVYELLSSGDTAGVFQLESSGMRDLLIRMKPNTFEDLIAILALYRPGPLGSGMVDDFINRKLGRTPIVYDLPQLKPILEDTYGVIVYQEQVMQISSALAGYSLGEADLLRRAMGKKKAEEMAAQRVRFLQGAEKNKIPKEKAEKIFDLMAKFAEYGFNKSHSAAYALVSFQTAYLKAHYPVEYLAAVLSTEMHDTDRIQFYSDDLKPHKITLLPPNVNTSYFGFSVVDNKSISYGLGAVKGVGEGAIDAIVEARKEKGPYTSFSDFCMRVDHHRVNKRVIESLIKCGAFDTIEKNRAMIFDSIEELVSLAIKSRKEKSLGQESIFGFLNENPADAMAITKKDGPDWPDNQKLAFEKEALGFYFSNHPLMGYRTELESVSNADTLKIKGLTSDASVSMAGMIKSIRMITTKKGARMAFVNFEDLKGVVEVIVFPKTFQKYADILKEDLIVIMKGTVDRTEEGSKVLADEFFPLADFLGSNTRSVRFKIPSTLLTEDKLKSFNDILGEYTGSCKGYLHVIELGGVETVLELPKGLRMDDRDNLSVKVNHLFGTKIVEFGL